MSVSCKFEIINQTLKEEDNLLNISSLCKIAGVSRSGYYRWIKTEEVRQKREQKDKEVFVADNILNREFTEHGARKVLLTDITYIPYNNKFCYLSTIIDAYTKQVLSYTTSDSLEMDFVLETVKKLVKWHGISLSTETLIHSDQGCHYTSSSFIQLVNDNGLRQSMSRKANCWDNAPQESFFGHMKDEIDVSKSITYREVKSVIDDWIDYYNNERYQWQLAKLSPNEYYQYLITGIHPLKNIII